MSYNKSQALTNNINAIRTAFLLKYENRIPSREEKDILEKYTGFGGLKCILDTRPVEEWPSSEKSLYPLVEELKQVIKENSDSESTAQSYFRSLKNSVLTAFYTPEQIVKTIGKQIENSTKGNIDYMLDPSSGNGVFLNFSEGKVHRTAYEKDLLTGLILSAKEPGTEVRVEGFENLPEMEEGIYDLVMSNIPFGTVKVYDYSYQKGNAIKMMATNTLHNYFFVKGIDAVKEGGLVVYITTRGVADSPSNKEIRRYLMQNANLISTIRLTDDLFTGTGGIEVGSDLIILQKNTQKRQLSYDEKLFIGSREDNPITPNNYVNNPIELHYLGIPYAEYVAILSGNTDLLDKAKLDKQITQLQKERVLFFRDIDKSKYDLKKLSEKKEAAESAVQDMKADYDKFYKSKGVLISQDGTRLHGKDAGKYLSAWRSASMEDGVTEYIGTYKEHTIYIKSLQGNKYFGLVGSSGRHYQAQTALPLAYDRCQEWLDELGNSLSGRAEKMEKDISRFNHDISELEKKLTNINWPKEEKLRQLKSEAAILNNKINNELKNHKDTSVHTEYRGRTLDVNGDKVILSVDGKEYDLSSDIAQALKSEGMSISDLTYNNWDTLTKGMPLSINKNKNLMIVKNLSSYSVRLNDATKSVASSSEMEAE